MKILVIAPTPFFSDRGSHIRILEEARALEARGHSITIATYHIGKDPQDFIKTTIKTRRIIRLLFWYKKVEAGPDWQKIILNLLLIRKVFYLLRTEHPDAVHGHLHEGALIGWLMKKLFWRRDFRLVVDFHGSLVREMVSHNYLSFAWLRRLFAQIERLINRCGDVAIASSQENAQEIARKRVDRTVHVVEDGVNISDYENLDNKLTLRDKFHLPRDKKIILYTGALLQDKGIAHILSAAREMSSQYKDVHFVFGGYPRNDVAHYIEKYELHEMITLVSPLSFFDLPALNSCADIAIDPKDDSTRQASGKILQYMAASLPIICIDRPTNRHYLGDDAMYVQAGEGAEGMITAITTLLNDEQKCHALGQKSKEHAQTYSWTNAGEKLEKIYQCKIGELRNKHL